MRKTLRLALITGGLIAAMVGSTAPAGAGTTLLTMTVTPSSGPGGTIATFDSVNPCPSGGGSYDITAGISTVPSPTDADFLTTTPVNADGSWQLTTTIASDAAVGPITFYAECRATFVGAPIKIGNAAVVGTLVWATYNPVTFFVVAPTTTTTTAAPTTTTTAPTTTTTAVTTTTTKPASMSAVPNVMTIGDTCHVTGNGFMPGTMVTVTVHSTPVVVGTIAADSSGDVSTLWQVPTGFELGSHIVQLDGTGFNGLALHLEAPVTIGAAVTPAPVQPAALPATGSDLTTPLGIGGAVLILAGGATVVVSRRRRIDE